MRRFLLGLASVLLATPAMALISSDSIQITDANGAVLNDINGNPASAVLPETPGGQPGEGMINGLFTFDFAGSFTTGIELLLTEGPPSPSGFTVVSDLVGTRAITVTTGPGTAIDFLSDIESESTRVDCSLITCIAETGQPQDVTGFLFPGVAVPPFHVVVQSDIAEVSEPSTAALLTAGLGLLSAVRRRGLRPAA